MKNILLLVSVCIITMTQAKENEMCIVEEKSLTVFKNLTIFCVDEQKFVSLNDQMLTPIKNISTKEKQCDCAVENKD